MSNNIKPSLATVSIGILLILIGLAFFFYGIGLPYMELLKNKNSITFHKIVGFCGLIFSIYGVLLIFVPGRVLKHLESSRRHQVTPLSLSLMILLLLAFLILDTHIDRVRKEKGYKGRFERVLKQEKQLP